MDRINRIKEIEAIYDEVSDKVDQLYEALDNYKELEKKIEELKAYMVNEYMDDYELDENGMLPVDLKKGILAQDGLYELLVKIDHINEVLKEMK